MEKLNRNFQCEISNLSYWTECFCVDLILLFFSPPLLQQKLTSNDIILWQINSKTIDLQNQHNLHPHDEAYYMFICLIHIKIVTREKKNRDRHTCVLKRFGKLYFYYTITTGKPNHLNHHVLIIISGSHEMMESCHCQNHP